jgi:hypothetical protein
MGEESSPSHSGQFLAAIDNPLPRVGDDQGRMTSVKETLVAPRQSKSK